MPDDNSPYLPRRLKMMMQKLLGSGGALALLLFGSSVARADNLPVFTSPIDATGARLQLHTAAPQRDTQQLVDVTLPTGLLPPKTARLFATPLNTQIDQYWNNPDPETGLVPRQAACDGQPATNKTSAKDGIRQILTKKVAGIGHGTSAYDISCNLATAGQVLVEQVTPQIMYVAYQLTNNRVTFKSTSPATCNASHTSFGCPDDPQFTVTFTSQIVTILRTPSLCQIDAEQGTVYTQAAHINADNGAADAAKLIFGDKFAAAEEAMMQTVQSMPLPITDDLNELRNGPACTGGVPGVSRLLSAFQKLETDIDLHNRAIILRAVHVGITRPDLGVPNPGGAPAPISSTPSFTHPQIATSQPIAKAGTAVQVSGQYFPPNTNVATMLPVTMGAGRYGNSSMDVCLGGGADLEWGPVGQVRVQRLPGDGQGRCPAHFDATNLTPNRGYQFRVRDCDPITCSPWSETVSVTTAKIDPNWGKVVLTLDSGHVRNPRIPSRPLATGTIDARGTFAVSVTIPSSTPAGTHTIHAVNGLNGDGRPATATENIQVIAATSSAQASLMMVGLLQGQSGCPNQPISSAGTDDPFMLFGSGFAAGTVTIRLDTATGATLGIATVHSDGSFCQQMQSVPRSQSGKHTLLAMQSGAVIARLATEFVVPEVIH
jgi:hypothetical protein